MRLSKAPLAALIFMLFALQVHAQSTRILIGTIGVLGFGNAGIGPSFAIEAPFARHFELDLKDDFQPAESHIALGRLGQSSQSALTARSEERRLPMSSDTVTDCTQIGTATISF